MGSGSVLFGDFFAFGGRHRRHLRPALVLETLDVNGHVLHPAPEPHGFVELLLGA